MAGGIVKLESAVEQVVEQTVEIEEIVTDALELLDQIRYSLKTLEDRLAHLATARGDRGANTPHRYTL